MEVVDDPCEDDVFVILVATDIHLGFDEKDPIRDQDTFNTFEEILQIASAEEVDFILLGGDLFHHAQPSPYCIYKCTELLKKYCLGDRPIEIEFLSDPTQNFRANSTVNYEDPNLNVGMPVFSIHGNHDDPTGQRQISAMDLLASSGLVNYFGRWDKYDHVDIDPILLKKGNSKVALYGLSHIKDERFGRLFIDKKVIEKVVVSDVVKSVLKIISGKNVGTPDQDDWFHLLVWHQNRATRGVKNFIPDSALPEFLDLVIWGHEHDCRIVPEKGLNNVYISQPGSSVATSLAAGEAIPKKVGILKVHKKDFQMIPVELKTVRPFIFEEMVMKSMEDLEAENDKDLSPSELVLEIVKEKVDNMIRQSKELGRTTTVSANPLIRLNVKCKDESQIFNPIRFGQSYVDIVANPKDMVKCNLLKLPVRNRNMVDDMPDVELAVRPEDMVMEYFIQNDSLRCLPINSVNEAIRKHIDTNDVEAPILALEHLFKETLAHLTEVMPDIEEVDDVIGNFKVTRNQTSLNSVNKLLNDSKRQKNKPANNGTGDDSDDDVHVIDDDDDDGDKTTNPGGLFAIAPRKPGRGSARGTRGASRARRARGARGK